MNNISFRFVLFIFTFVVIAPVYAANDRALFWEVTSAKTPAEHATVYLLGSIHFADSSFYPLRAAIEDAFDRSDYLVVELDVNKTDSRIYHQLLTEKGVYQDGRTIKDELSAETWQQLNQRLRYLNIDYESIKRYKPGILVLTLSAAQVMRMGFDPQLGIDAHFLAMASRQGQQKKILEFESLEQQLDLFLEVPDAELLLKETLYSLDESEALMADIVRYWKQGDIEQMNKLLFEDAIDDYPAFGNIYDSLFYGRNRQMMIKIDEMLKTRSQTKKIYFVVVGSGHLIGEQGIVNLLQKKGYNIRRL